MAPEYAILKKFEQLHTSISVIFQSRKHCIRIEWLTQGHSAISHKMSLQLTASFPPIQGIFHYITREE